MDLKDVFIAKARKYNHYQEGEHASGRNCKTCVRWQFSYPYTCKDCDFRSDKGASCINWTDDKNCPVD